MRLDQFEENQKNTEKYFLQNKVDSVSGVIMCDISDDRSSLSAEDGKTE